MKRSVTISVGVHVLFAAGLLVLPGRFSRTPEEQPIEIVFYPAKPAPVLPPDEPEPIPEPEPEPLPEPVEIVEREPAPEPLRVIEREPEPRLMPRKIARKPEPRPQPEVVAPQKPKPVVRTNVLAESRPEPETKKTPARTVKATDGFATTEKTEQRPRQETARIVAGGGFGNNEMTVPRRAEPAAPREAVMTASFETPTEGASTAPARTGGSVDRGGFGDGVRETRKTARRELPEESLDNVVEIVSKVNPVYTDEARRLRIEGEVVLEVQFIRSGELRVLRVVGGLGHGLDEAAIDAAKRIRFKPARRNGLPVDHTTTLRVVFRLA